MHLLTTEQQNRLREVARRSPAFRGMRVAVHDDHIEVTHPEPLTFGFAGLAGVVANAPVERWPELVDDYLTRAVAAVTAADSEVDGPTADVLERTYLKLVQTPHEPAADYAVEVVPGLSQMFAYDYPDHIRFLTDETVRRHGHDRLYEAGARNLCRQLPARYAERNGVIVLEGSDYVGSLVLVLPSVLEALTGVALPEHGALVAMPSRNLLLCHVIGEHDAAWRARDEMMGLAAECYAGSSHQLSPWVYWWWPDGSIEPLTESDEFADMMLDLTLDQTAAHETALTGTVAASADGMADGTLTDEQAERLRRLVRRSPAFIGMRIEMHDDHVRVLEPVEGTLGLGPVVAAVAGAPADEWPDRVDEVLGRMLRPGSGTPAPDEYLAVPTDELLDRVHLFLVPHQDADESMSYADEVLPGLLRVFTCTYPDRLIVMSGEDLGAHDIERLFDAGLRNLCDHLPETFSVTDQDVYVLEGSMYVGSMALILQWVVEAATGSPECPHGVLFASPNHTQLMFHVLRDAAGAEQALAVIAELAAELYADGSSPLSAWVYWWRPDGVVEQVARHDGAGGARLVPGHAPELGRVLEVLENQAGRTNAPGGE